MYTINELHTAKTWYAEGKTVEEIATEIGKSPKSVIAKLSLEGVYKRKIRPSKITGGEVRLKKSYVDTICKILEVEELEGLDKAPKGTLIKLEETIVGWLGDE